MAKAGGNLDLGLIGQTGKEVSLTLLLPAEFNHHRTLYAGSLPLSLEAGYAS